MQSSAEFKLREINGKDTQKRNTYLIELIYTTEYKKEHIQKFLQKKKP